MGTDIDKLKEVAIFRNFSQAMLAEFAKSFKQTRYEKDAVVFREKSEGDTLFIILDGGVVIEKKLDEEGKEFKQLAILSKGEFFGEMAVLEGGMRFAQARASVDTVLYEVKRDECFRFVKEHPEAGIGIFTEIMKSTSRRLQHTSSELTMLFDMANLIMADHPSAGEFLKKAVEEISIYFEGSWNFDGYLYNQFNEEYDPVVSKESFAGGPGKNQLNGKPQSGWLDDSAYLMAFSADRKPLGYIVFARSAPLAEREKNNLVTTFNTIASILSSAILNIEHRTEAALMRKLKTQKYSI